MFDKEPSYAYCEHGNKVTIYAHLDNESLNKYEIKNNSTGFDLECCNVTVYAISIRNFYLLKNKEKNIKTNYWFYDFQSLKNSKIYIINDKSDGDLTITVTQSNNCFYDYKIQIDPFNSAQEEFDFYIKLIKKIEDNLLFI